MSITAAHRGLIIFGAILVAGVAMAASAATLAALGRTVGWGYILSWALPFSVDVLALVAGLAWIAGGSGRGLGRLLTLLTVAVSVLLNSVGHLVSTGHLATGPVLVIGVSAVPPLAAALAVHLGATVTTDRTAPSADRDEGRANETGPGGTDQGARAEQMPDPERWRTVDQPADPVVPDDGRGPAEGSGPVGADRDAPADQLADREPPQTADHDARTTDQPADLASADQRTNPAPDRPDPEADQPLDPPADQDEDGSAGGPQGARTTNHDASTPGQRTKPAGQDEVPWEVKVEVARKAALEEGRMTRAVLRPHLRNANITVSNALFSDLQAALYADPTLAHLPRDTRRAR
ncbi:DUF2637 domain-containing protein [Streptomyces sp. NPDC001205]